MFITHKFLGVRIEPYRCLFFLLLEDYIEPQTHLVKELDAYLERFARSLGDSAPLVRSFAGDIASTRQQILDKPWLERDRTSLCQTPGLLMIEKSFDDFDPRADRWVYLHLGERLCNESDPAVGALRLGKALQVLAAAVATPSSDPFLTAKKLEHEITGKEAEGVFLAQPGAFGFSIDLVKASKVLKKLYRQLRVKKKEGKSPNQAPHPTALSVTPAADAPVAPARGRGWS
jgi:hypothetical protein